MIPAAQIWAIDERQATIRPAHTKPVQLTLGPIRWGAPTPDKDGKRIFSRGVTLRGELVRFDLQSQRPEPYLSGISAEFVTFSPDGKYLAYVTFPDGILWRANRDGSNATQLTDPPLYPTLLHWSPDGKQILFNAANSQGLRKIYVLPSQGGKPQLLIPNDNRIQSTADWSSDGQRVVFETRELADPSQMSIHILDLSSGRVTDVPGSEGFWSPRWSPDGRYIDGLTGELIRDHVLSSLAVFDFRTQRWSVIHEGEVGYPLWSHDGKFIYFVSPVNDPGVYRIRPSGGEAERVVDLKSFRYTSVWRYFLGLDPEDTPLMLRDTGTDDIFALTLDDR
jgi:Tol biopolymer transport system component